MIKSKSSKVLLFTFGGFVLTIIVLAVTINTGLLNTKPSEPDINDGGFLSGEPCGPPCFLEIIPNVTRETQAVQFLKAKGLYKNCYIYNNEDESGLRGAACPIVEITYFRSTDIVGSVSFRPSQKITIEMVIAKYGKPDAVSISTIWFNWEDHPNTSMSLIYDDINASIGLGEQKGNKFSITPTTQVEGIGYSDPTFPTISEYEHGKKFLSSWHGYGEYVDTNP